MLFERLSKLIDSFLGVRREEPFLGTSLIKHAVYIAEMCDLPDEEWDNLLWTLSTSSTKIGVSCTFCGRK